MKPAEKVILNTVIQYARVFATMGMTLYAVRLVLKTMGEVDYGIFNLIAGVVSMFTFFNGAMATSTQRFLSFHHDKGDIQILKKIFGNSLLLHFVVAVLIVLILELTGLYLFNGFLRIPVERQGAAHLVYHYVCTSIFFTIISMPFTSLLIAHENIVGLALLNTIDIALKLLAAIFLFIFSGDHLVIYGLLTAILNSFSFILIAAYCFYKYEDCAIIRALSADSVLIKKLASFAGWNLFGALCSLARYEGLAILLNLFLGPVVNASFGIANQVAAQLSFFSVTMLRVISPQIIKSEGAGDRPRMLRLSMIASKFGFYLLAIIAIPCIFEMPAILSIWLKDIPEGTVIFCCLVLAGTMINQLTSGLEIALQATGKIKSYQIIVGMLLLCNIPLAYILLKNGFPAYMALLSYALIELLACAARIRLTKNVAGLSIREYFSRVFEKEIIPLCSIIFTCFLITRYTRFEYRFLLTSLISVMVFSASIYLAGLCADEKKVLRQNFNTFTKKLRWRKPIA